MAMTEAEINEGLRGLDGWQREGNAISREFRLGDFRGAVAFLVRVAFEAEQRNHHPEVFNVYDRVKLTLTTHDAGGVTEQDFDLARAVEGLV
jgi:4a-hydroxytetrahydrobiopterin dehydratase